jgi:hypothetical protein
MLFRKYFSPHNMEQRRSDEICKTLSRGGDGECVCLHPLFHNNKSHSWSISISGNGTLTTRYQGTRLERRFKSVERAMKEVIRRYAEKVAAGYTRLSPGVAEWIDRIVAAPPFTNETPTFPAIVQPQIPGVLCIAWFNAEAEYAQLLAFYNDRWFIDVCKEFEPIRKCLTNALRNRPSLFVVGKLYHQTLSLEKILHYARGNACSKCPLSLYIDDVIDTQNKNEPLLRRLALADSIVNSQSVIDKRLVKSPSVIVNNGAEARGHATIYRSSGLSAIKVRPHMSAFGTSNILCV